MMASGYGPLPDNSCETNVPQPIGNPPPRNGTVL